MSPKTVEAYRRDVHQFLAFLAEHFGTRVTLKRLGRLSGGMMKKVDECLKKALGL